MDLSSREEKHIRWLAEEAELNRKHEEILAKREVLLASSASLYGNKEKKTKTMKHDYLKAKARNDQLIKEFLSTQESLKKKAHDPSGASFIALRDSYYATVEKEWPQWFRKGK